MVDVGRVRRVPRRREGEPAARVRGRRRQPGRIDKKVFRNDLPGIRRACEWDGSRYRCPGVGRDNRSGRRADGVVYCHTDAGCANATPVASVARASQRVRAVGGLRGVPWIGEGEPPGS